MFHSWRQICEVILAQRLNLVPVVQNACTVRHEINFLLTVVEDRLAGAVRIQSDFAEASYCLKGSTLLVSLTENCPVVASLRAEIALRFPQVGNVTMHPSRINLPVLRLQPVCEEYRH